MSRHSCSTYTEHHTIIQIPKVQYHLLFFNIRQGEVSFFNSTQVYTDFLLEETQILYFEDAKPR